MKTKLYQYEPSVMQKILNYLLNCISKVLILVEYPYLLSVNYMGAVKFSSPKHSPIDQDLCISSFGS